MEDKVSKNCSTSRAGEFLVSQYTDVPVGMY